MGRSAVQRSATIRWRRSLAGGCVYLMLLVNVLGCGGSQSSERQGSATPTTPSDTSTTTSTPRSGKPKARAEKPKAHPTTKQGGANAPNVTKKPHTPIAAGSGSDTKGIASCLKNRGYGQARTIATPALPGGGQKAPVTVVPLIIGPPRKPRVTASLIYLTSASQATRFANGIKARVRNAGMGAFQVAGRVVITYTRAPGRKLSQAIGACIR